MKRKFINYFMRMAELTSELSYATRLKVGAVIVKGNQIIGTGYNGMPTGWDNNCEERVWAHNQINEFLTEEELKEQYPLVEYSDIDLDCVIGRYKLKTKPQVLHAESNAILKVTRSTESSEGATLFCTHAPCIECAKLIYQSGISTVYYKDQYRDDSGLQFLVQGNVNVHRYTEDI